MMDTSVSFMLGTFPILLTADQMLLALLGALAAWLSQDKRELQRRWSSVFGLLAQPLWFYSTWKTQQWGSFLLCIVFLGCWMRGFYYSWIEGRF